MINIKTIDQKNEEHERYQNNQVLLEKHQDGFNGNLYEETNQLSEIWESDESQNVSIDEEPIIQYQEQQSSQNSPLTFQNIFTDIQIYLEITIPIEFSEQIWNILSLIYYPIQNDQSGYEQTLIKLKKMLDDQRIQVHSVVIRLLQLLLQMLASNKFNPLNDNINIVKQDRHLQYLNNIYDQYQEYQQSKVQNDGIVRQTCQIEIEQALQQNLESRLIENSF